MLIDSVFGPDGINEGKTGIWLSYFRFLGFLWDLRSGTVTLPKDKLARAKQKMMWLIRQNWVTNTQLLSTTGLLRHLATCCKPANALIQRLGGATSKYKTKSNRKIPITDSIREELQWWIDNLDPESFQQMHLEWLSSSIPPVDHWLHVYVDTSNDCIWIVNWASHQIINYPCPNSSNSFNTRLAILSALNDVAHHWFSPHSRLSHTRVILNSCSLARTINRCSSSNPSEIPTIRSFGLLQLKSRQRFTATTPRWEAHAPNTMTVLNCHLSNLTNLFSMMLQNMPSPPTVSGPKSVVNTISGESNRSLLGHMKHIDPIGCTGALSSWKSTCRHFSWMSTLLATAARSCRGLRSLAPQEATINKALATRSQLTRQKNPLLSGSIASSGISPHAFLAPIWFLSRNGMRNLPLLPTPNIRFPYQCSVPLGTIFPSIRFGAKSATTASFCPTFTSVGVGKCGSIQSHDSQSMTVWPSIGLQCNLTNWPTNQIIESDIMKSTFTTSLESNSLHQTSITPIQLPSNSYIPRQTKSDEMISFHIKDPGAMSSVQSFLPYKSNLHVGNSHDHMVHPSEGLYPLTTKPLKLIPLSNRLPNPSKKIPTITPFIRSALELQPPCSMPDTTLSLSN